MGSGNWFRSIICIKKSKSDTKKPKVHSANEKSNGGGEGSHEAPEEARSPATTGGSLSSPGLPGMPVEEMAAARIQKAFRAYRARKAVRRLRDAGRFNILIQGHTVKKQTSSTLSYLHSWCNVQSQIRARRICMVTEGRLKQKKMENQIKLEAKLHELEVEWCGGSETMEEILSRIQQREEAAVKRERAMAYAFSHQWRANASQYLGQASYGLGKENWGWSWMERWIAARPWEVRVHSQPIHPRKTHARQSSKSEKEMKVPSSLKPALPNGKVAPKVKKVAPTDG
ncbi:protein IQ-DOMAIN 1-like isoform X2 [Durio zibethinus]|uniref:Protein IQ-DOMAIN 1-like isoform X2 n=1 Tax=Durio zibethinus TaxID=66656 RepID=A0A6P5Y1R8_DURZI|nr:protein IQ-DOMAIN 1-like isoform X2 [Durio zibethinus]